MDKLREWMWMRKVSAVDLAASIGVHVNSIHNWLEGRTCPNGIMLRKLHERTSIPLDDLVPKN